METKPVDLETLLPSKPTFSLFMTQKSYELRLMTIADWAWVKARYKGKSDKEIQETMRDTEHVLPVIHRLMTDKSDFLAGTYPDQDSDEKGKKVKLTGPQVLMRHVTLKDLPGIFEAFEKSMGLSEEVKKKPQRRKPK